MAATLAALLSLAAALPSSAAALPSSAAEAPKPSAALFYFEAPDLPDALGDAPVALTERLKGRLARAGHEVLIAPLSVRDTGRALACSPKSEECFVEIARHLKCEWILMGRLLCSGSAGEARCDIHLKRFNARRSAFDLEVRGLVHEGPVDGPGVMGRLLGRADPLLARLTGPAPLAPVEATPAAPAPAPRRPLVRNPWLWTAIAVVTIGAITAGVLVGQGNSPEPWVIDFRRSGE